MGDSSDDWEFQRIGTESEKSSVEKELAELRERLAKVGEWESRKREIEEELGKVWVKEDGEGEELAPPPYLEREEGGSMEESGYADEEVESPRSDEQAVESVDEEEAEAESPMSDQQLVESGSFEADEEAESPQSDEQVVESVTISEAEGNAEH
jgi:ATP-binding cassette subfamily D (ALD) long-chain fatty acid import protein